MQNEQKRLAADMKLQELRLEIPSYKEAGLFSFNVRVFCQRSDIFDQRDDTIISAKSPSGPSWVFFPSHRNQRSRLNHQVLKDRVLVCVCNDWKSCAYL